MLAYGFQVINFLLILVLASVGIVAFLFFSKRKRLALAVTFVAVVIGLCQFLLYLILVPQR